MWSDGGKKSLNKTILDFLEQCEIQNYSTTSVLKAVFLYYFSRILLDLIKEPM